MPIRLATKSRNEPYTATISEPRVMPMPLTQSIGTKATAIATPAIEFDKCLRIIENESATATAMAMPRSIRFGDVRPVISDCTWLMLSPN